MKASVLLATALCCVAVSAHSATYRHQVLLDTDNNTATGCAVAVNELNYAGGPVNGVEHVVEMVVDDGTAPARVVQVNRQACSGGSLGAPVQVDAGDWNVGTDNGSNGADVVEGYVARAAIGNPSQMKVTFFSSGPTPASDLMTVAGALSLSSIATAVPTLREGGLLLLSLLLAGLAYRFTRRRLPGFMVVALAVTAGIAGYRSAEAAVATIAMDGNVTDWAGVAAVGTDPTGDTSNNNPPEDIVAGFVAWDAQNVYFRVDLNDASITCPPGTVPLPFSPGTCI